MAYTAMKKLITNENNKFNNGTVTADEYNLWKQDTRKKLDVFYACDRLALSQYEELTRMLIDTESESISE